MEILMVGAGVLGSNLAHKLKKKHHITLFVRKETYECLKDNGIVIRHKPVGWRSVDHYSMVTEFDLQKEYDLILVPVRYTQLGDTLDLIQKSWTKNILFVGNNVRAEEIRLPGKNVLFGFFHAAGSRHDGYVDSVCMSKFTGGQLCGNGEQNQFLQNLFRGTGVRLEIQNHMGDWLKTHAAAILPVVFAAYQTNGNLKLLAKDKTYSIELIQAVKELYDVLQDFGYEILPVGEYETTANKQKRCARLYRFLFSCWIGQTCISDHAMHAREEMAQLLSEFDFMKANSKYETPVFDKLRKNSGF